MLSLLLLLLPARAALGCGDGTVDPTEACDDSNLSSGDGCSPDCLVEEGFVCQLAEFELYAAESFVSPGDAPPDWEISADGRIVTQSVNSAPTIFSSTLPSSSLPITFRIRVNTTSDDDFVGFAIGFSPGESTDPNADYMLFSWKQATQNFSNYGTADRGFAVSRVRGIADGPDFWDLVGTVQEVRRGIRFGTTGWADNTSYWVRFDRDPGRIRVWISTDATIDDVAELELDLDEGSWIAATGSGFPDGTFGFYGYSQADTEYELVAPFSTSLCALCTDVDNDLVEDLDGNGLGDACDCIGEPAWDALLPPTGSAWVAGDPVLVSGQVSRVNNTRPIAQVLVAGQPADSVDAFGRFFDLYDVPLGPVPVVIEAFDRCGVYTRTLDLLGVTRDEQSADALQELTHRCDTQFIDTTWATDQRHLLVKATLQNTGPAPMEGPVLLAIGDDLHPSITPLAVEGAWNGLPYVVMVPEGEQLDPGEVSDLRQLVFLNPEQRYNGFTPRCLAPANRPPRFVSAPVTTGTIGRPWAYDADASDPDRDVLRYRLLRGPATMTIDPLTALLSWTPGEADEGSHDVAIEVTDGRGGLDTQTFAVLVDDGALNRPPRFITPPVTTASVGGHYVYDSEAFDPDQDVLTYTLLEGPAGLAIDAATGLLSWPFALPGNHPVALRADDGRGGTATQRYTITAGVIPPNNHAPQIISTPPVAVGVYDLYLYPAIGVDPDDDVLTWTLDYGPSGLGIDPDTGRVAWIPTDSQLGFHDVGITVADPAGLSASQAWQILVYADPPNLPPFFVTTPPLQARVGVPYAYDGEALDPEGGPVSYVMVVGDPDMGFDDATCLVSWVPAPEDEGTDVLVALQATDDVGQTGSQVWSIDVRGPNRPPTIISPPPTEAIVGETLLVDVFAVDPDDDPVTYGLVDPPPGMVIDPPTGIVTWTPTLDDVGEVPVTATADDPWGGHDEQPWTIDVRVDTEPPDLFIELTPGAVCLDEPARVCVRAADEGQITSLTLEIDGVPEPLTAGCTTLVSATPRVWQLLASATDSSGNAALTASQLVARDCNDGEPPVVTLIAPPVGSVLWMPTELEVRITDNQPDSLTWTVELSPRNEGDWTLLETGTGPVDGPITTIDTAVLRNGDYDVRVIASDGASTAGILPWYTVAGTYKPGRFRVTVPDGVFQLAGIGIGVERTYDSYDTAVHDFGHGWTLGLSGYVRDAPFDGDDSFIGLFTTEPFRTGTRVCATLPGGRESCFTFEPRQGGFPVPYVWHPVWTADPCSGDTLVAEGGTSLFNFGTGFLDFILPYNPELYWLTTEEGVRYTLHEVHGLLQIEDAYGGVIDVNPDGLVHSDGARVDFERDGQDRIMAAQLPDADPSDALPGERWTYTYSPDGNLTHVYNTGALVYEYRYEVPEYPHYLTTMLDAEGRVVLRTIYDEDGRMIAQCGPDGDPETLEGCDRFERPDLSSILTLVDGRGNTVDQLFDAHGNLVLERHLDPQGTPVDVEYTYDACDLLLSQSIDGDAWTFHWEEGALIELTAPGGRSWSYSYDETCELMTAEVSPRGDVRLYSYNEYCETTDIFDATGGHLHYEYDDQGRVREITDGAGDRWLYTWTPSGNMASMTTPSGGVLRWTYDDLGRLRTKTDADGRQISYDYDAQGLLRTETWDTVPPRVITYTWDAAGLLESVSDPDSALAFTWYDDGQLHTVDTTGTPGAPPVTLTYTYDGADAVHTVADSLGGLTTWDWDFLGRLSQVRQQGAGVADKRVDLAYDDATRMGRITRYADLAGAAPVFYTELGYDLGGGPNRLTSLHHRRADGGVIHDLDLVLDPQGNLTASTDAEGAHTWLHDGQQRVISGDHPPGMADERYVWDGAGNRASSHLAPDYGWGREAGGGGDLLLADDRYTYTWTASGELRSRTAADGARDELSWDHRGRLVQVRQLSPAGTLTRDLRYRWDALNRLIRVDDDGAVLHLVYDGENPVLVLDAAGEVVVRRLYGRVMDQIFAEERAGGVRWPVTDQVGTVRDVVDSSGAIVAHHVYDAFGRLIGGDPLTGPQPLGFQARPYDAGTGLYFWRARFYDPGAGRFLSPDPLAPHGYSFVEGNPLSWRDPTGESVAIEYACLASYAVFAGSAFGVYLAEPTGQLFWNVAGLMEIVNNWSRDGRRRPGSSSLYGGFQLPIPDRHCGIDISTRVSHRDVDGGCFQELKFSGTPPPKGPQVTVNGGYGGPGFGGGF